MNDFRLAMTVTHANGRSTRWGPDAPNGEDIPADLTFSTSIPGGFRDLTCSLLRRIDRTYPDENLFDDVRVYTAGGGSTAWEGRIAQLPRQHGDSFGVTPGAVGWAAHLKDDPSFREIYRDIDVNHWTSTGIDRQLNLISNTVTYHPPEIVNDATTEHPSVKAGFIGAWVGRRPTCEAEYNGQGIPIASVYYDWTKTSTISSANVDWEWALGISATPGLDGSFTTGNLRAATSTPGTYSRSDGTSGYYAQTYLINNNATSGSNGVPWAIYWKHLAVTGAHGVSKRGTEPDAGLYASDIIAHVIDSACPMLTRNAHEQNFAVVPHAVFLDPVTPEEAISLINAYTLWEWGVWEDRDFFYRPPSLTRTLWRARLSNGAKVDLEGDTAEQVFNGVFVTYQDASGQRKTVGPPGALADNTDSALEDTSDSNPVNSHGIPRRWAKLEISVPTTLAGATLIGQTYLAERLIASRRGTITLSGTAIHPTKGERPVWEIRAGDSILIEDRTGDVARRVIQTDYRHANREIQLTCDNTSSKLDAILERLGIGLIGRF